MIRNCRAWVGKITMCALYQIRSSPESISSLSQCIESKVPPSSSDDHLVIHVSDDHIVEYTAAVVVLT